MCIILGHLVEVGMANSEASLPWEAGALNLFHGINHCVFNFSTDLNLPSHESDFVPHL